MIINCPNDLSNFNKVWKIFLAGPIQGGPDWQNNMPDRDNIVWFSPRRPVYPMPNFNYAEQVNWETAGLRMSNIILCWIPEPVEDIQGRSYAQTTRFELGENIARGKRIIIGAYKGFPGRRYLEQKAENYGNVIGNKIFNSLEECLDILYDYIDSIEPTTLFTSDTHFSSERALEYSKRPFHDTEDMDWSLIEKWNNKVNPCDTVWHIGDFGETWPLNYLSGSINFLYGNYEHEGVSTIDYTKVDKVYQEHTLTIDIDGEKFFLTHEPIPGKDAWKDDKQFCLFGHIHGRQKIKEWGGLDVGVDCNNYEPVSLDEVKFYKNALIKGYYDEEVFC